MKTKRKGTVTMTRRKLYGQTVKIHKKNVINNNKKDHEFYKIKNKVKTPKQSRKNQRRIECKNFIK